MVVVPGAEGDFGVLEGHAPFMSTIRNGDIAIYRQGMTASPSGSRSREVSPRSTIAA
jgi:F-type H+-transporting ATPase subunit epsilon